MNTVKEHRLDRGMTLQAVADIAGTSKGHIHDIENNRKEPRVTTALKIAKALRVNVTKLWGIE